MSSRIMLAFEVEISKSLSPKQTTTYNIEFLRAGENGLSWGIAHQVTI